MALNEEQKLMEEKIINAGYQLKFDAQLHSMKNALVDKNSRLEVKKNKLIKSKESDIYNYSIDLSEEERVYYELDDDGNSIEKSFTDEEIKNQAEVIWQIKVDDYSNRIAFNIENLSWLTSEIDFRNQGLVTRDPKGTTFYVDAMQSGNGSEIDQAWRYLYSFVNIARTGGDVCICRRTRGGFNPNDSIFINRYSRHAYNATGSSDSEVDNNNFKSPRDVGYEEVSQGTIGTGRILAWNQVTDNYGHGVTKNRSGIVVSHDSAKQMIGDTHTSGDRTINGDGTLPGATPRAVHIKHIDPNSNDHVVGYSTTATKCDINRITNPRDKSRWIHLHNRLWDMSQTGVTRLITNSSGEINNPIVITADFENVWGDFLDTGQADPNPSASEPNGWGHDGDDAQYEVTVGSKIIRRKRSGTQDPVEVHSYITPGDWIFVGKLTESIPRTVDGTYSDDPYEFSYQVRDVNYDKIVLWLPYKGEQAGTEKTLVSMGYAPRMQSNSYDSHSNDTDETHIGNHLFVEDDTNWFWQGIEFFDSWGRQTNTGAYTEDRMIQSYFGGGCQMKFKDCSFFGQSNGDNHETVMDASHHQKRHTYALIRANYDSNDLQYEKCVFGNTRYVFSDYYNIVANNIGQRNSFKFSDSIMNGSILDNQFVNQCSPTDHITQDHHTSLRTSHINPMNVIYSRDARSDFEFTECEMVNWKHSIFKTSPWSNVKCRSVKFFGQGLDFIDPTVNNDADAQENLGLRYARAMFSGTNGIHPTQPSSTARSNNHLGTADATGDWEYDMIYPAGDAEHGANSNGMVLDLSSVDPDTFGKYKNDTNWAEKGSKWFLYTSTDVTGGVANSTDGAIVGTSDITRRDGARCYEATALWRTDANANSGGAYGYNRQATNGNTVDGGATWEGITTVNDPADTFGSEIGAWNDNQSGTASVFPFQGETTNYINWDNYLFFNGALAIMGAKGFDKTGGLVWDWDQNWRCGYEIVHANTASYQIGSNAVGSGSGGSWALRTSDGNVRYPHVYGGVRIPQSIHEGLGRLFCWFPLYQYSPDEGHPKKKNWPVYHSGGTTGSDAQERTCNNTTLAPENDGVTASGAINTGGHWGTGVTDNDNNTFDYTLSNGCGFGIGSAPVHGVHTIYDHQSSADYNRPVNQEVKKTSQDHYQMFLNYDYEKYKVKGYLTSHWERFNNKPLLTGVDGIGKGLIYQQGRFDHWRVTQSRYGNGYSDVIGYVNYPASADPTRRGTGSDWLTPMMETVVDNTLIQSGGGNYLIKVLPTWQLGRGLTEGNPIPDSGGDPLITTSSISANYERSWQEQSALKIFEYPFYLSTNSRTYTINIRPDRGDSSSIFSWLSNPSGQDIYLEMEFYDTTSTDNRLQQYRKLKRSNSSVDMNINDWSQLSVTVTPKSEGVGYLRLWYSKARESDKVNSFYVDPKVVVY